MSEFRQGWDGGEGSAGSVALSGMMRYLGCGERRGAALRRGGRKRPGEQQHVEASEADIQISILLLFHLPLCLWALPSAS